MLINGRPAVFPSASRFLCGSSSVRTAGASIHGRTKVGAGQASEADAIRCMNLAVRPR